MRFFSQFWAPDDPGAPQRPEEPSRQQPSQSRFAGEGQLGGTMSSRLGEALSAMDPGDAADTGLDPTAIYPPAFTGETWLAAQEGGQVTLPAGGQADTFFDQEAELAERRGVRSPQRAERPIDPEAPFREQRNELHLADIQPEAGTIDNDPRHDDEDHWRP